MPREEISQSIKAIDNWLGSAENQWKDAKSLLKDRINDELLNQWETTLYEQRERLNKLADDRTNEDIEHLLTELDQINQQCRTLLEDYESFTETFTQTGLRAENESSAETEQDTEDGRLEWKTSKNKWMPPQGSVPPGKHKLPPLPYAYNALEPTISEEIMRLHHDVHHKGYVDGLNKAETEMKKARQTGKFDLIRHWEREAAFNGAGHYLHTIFWDVMSPKGGGEPKGALFEQIKHDFGSYKAFKNHFTEAAKKVEGPGWAILVWSPRSHRLAILQAEKHQNLSQWDVVPLLVLDVWEHAYYLQYKTDKNKYVDNWWNVVNWENVSKRFNEAQKLRWKPY